MRQLDTSAPATAPAKVTPRAPRLRDRRRRPHSAAADLDVRWTHGRLVALARELVFRFVLGPLMALYARRRVVGLERLRRLRGPAVIVANHGSHMDTPALLRALPREWRRRTVVAAAVDYFYRDVLRATLVSLLFNTVPIERRRQMRSLAHIDRLLERGHALVLYPEGTRSRRGVPGRLRSGAAVLAARHGIPLVPVRISGTHEAMPPGRHWPRRRGGNLFARRHRVTVTIGDPIHATPDDTDAAMARVAAFFERGA